MSDESPMAGVLAAGDRVAVLVTTTSTLFVWEDPRRAHLVLLLAVVVLYGVVPHGVGLQGAARKSVEKAVEAHGEVAVVVRAVVPRALGDLRATSTRAPGAIRTVRRTLEIFPACRWPMALLLRTHATRSSSLNLPGIATRGRELVRPNTTRSCPPLLLPDGITP